MTFHSEKPQVCLDKSQRPVDYWTVSNFIVDGTEREWVHGITWKRVRLESPGSFLEGNTSRNIQLISADTVATLMANI